MLTQTSSHNKGYGYVRPIDWLAILLI